MNKLIEFESNLDDLLIFSKKIAGISRKGDWFFLKGDLGAGKTTFAKSYIQSLFELNKTDLPINIKSPSFPIVISYPLKNYTIYHYDFFRLNYSEEIFDLALEEYLEEGNLIIEWPEIAKKYLPEPDLKIKIEIDKL